MLLTDAQGGDVSFARHLDRGFLVDAQVHTGVGRCEKWLEAVGWVLLFFCETYRHLYAYGWFLHLIVLLSCPALSRISVVPMTDSSNRQEGTLKLNVGKYCVLRGTQLEQ
jgi:hypothetical protein